MILLFVCAPVAFITVVMLFALWIENTREGVMKIRFRQFLNLYAVAPGHWSFPYDSTLAYKSKFIRLGFLDYWRFRLWLSRKQNMEYERYRSAAAAELTECMLGDIERYREKAKREQQELVDRTEREAAQEKARIAELYQAKQV